jgi:hypothetical protein
MSLGCPVIATLCLSRGKAGSDHVSSPRMWTMVMADYTGTPDGILGIFLGITLDFSRL